MSPLPLHRYEAYKEDTVKIQYNMHISVEGTFYSVPYTASMKGDYVTVRIKIYQNGEFITEHKRTANKYSTIETHMPPPEIRDKLLWNGDRFRRWAAKIGPETGRVINAILDRHPIEQQCYNICMSILSLGKENRLMLEEACGHMDDAAMVNACSRIRNYLRTH